MRDFIRRLLGLSVLSRALLLAVCGLSALSAVSCRTQESVERSSVREDSLVRASSEYEVAVVQRQTVPGDTLSLTVPMSAIQSLPDGAVFTKKQGRTRVSLKRKGDAVVAEGETDSVGSESLRWERRARDDLRRVASARGEEIEARERSPTGSVFSWRLVPWVWGLGLLGALALLVLALRWRRL